MKLYKCVREKFDCKKIILHQMHNMLEAGKVMNCTMMALHKKQAENASWQISSFSTTEVKHTPEEHDRHKEGGGGGTRSWVLPFLLKRSWLKQPQQQQQ